MLLAFYTEISLFGTKQQASFGTNAEKFQIFANERAARVDQNPGRSLFWGGKKSSLVVGC